MANTLKFKKTILYTLLITPLIIVILESTLQLIFSKRSRLNSNSTLSRNIKRTNLTRFDAISGWRHNCDYNNHHSYFPTEVICNKHGLVKTPYSTSKKNNDAVGILLLGNSVAMGEGLYSKDNINT